MYESTKRHEINLLEIEHKIYIWQNTGQCKKENNKLENKSEEIIQNIEQRDKQQKHRRVYMKWEVYKEICWIDYSEEQWWGRCKDYT